MYRKINTLKRPPASAITIFFPGRIVSSNSFLFTTNTQRYARSKIKLLETMEGEKLCNKSVDIAELDLICI